MPSSRPLCPSLQDSGLLVVEERVLGFLLGSSKDLKQLATVDDLSRLLAQVGRAGWRGWLALPRVGWCKSTAGSPSQWCAMPECCTCHVTACSWRHGCHEPWAVVVLTC